MKYYIEITLQLDTEIGLGFLWKKVYQQIHLALVDINNTHIGVSFPLYGSRSFPMGDRLRVFASSREELKDLPLERRLDKLTDYLSISDISETPACAYVIFSRKQPKLSFMQRVEKQAKRHGVSIEEALEHFKTYQDKAETIKLPYINMTSLSSKPKEQQDKNNYMLFIDQKHQESSANGTFDTFGLTKDATVPWF